MPLLLIRFRNLWRLFACPLNPQTHLATRDPTALQINRKPGPVSSAYGMRRRIQPPDLAALVMLPAAFWVGSNWVEISLLIVTVVIVLVVELLNTAVEITIDRISPEWHELSKLAKDVSSAAVLLVLLLCGGIWLAAIYHRFF